jgi:hypothetical protein
VAWNFSRTGELPHHDPAQVEGVEKIANEDILPSQLDVEDNLHPAAPPRKD